jgi:predicted nucleic acid-binding protein
MFLLDTNVVSELRRPRRTHPKVAAWADSIPVGEFFLSSITVLELETGARLLARRDETQGRLIQEWIENRVLTAFADRVLAIDTPVARRCAQLHVPNPRPYRDSLIAATALVHGLTVATRNRADFEPMAVPVLNPWEYSP